LRAVLVRRWQIYLIAEDYEPLAGLCRAHDVALVRLLRLAVLVEGFEDQVRVRRRGEVDEDHLHICELLQSGHQGHCLARARRSAQKEWSLLAEPGAQDFLVSVCVDGRNDDVGIGDLARVYVQDRSGLRCGSHSRLVPSLGRWEDIRCQ